MNFLKTQLTFALVFSLCLFNFLNANANANANAVSQTSDYVIAQKYTLHSQTLKEEREFYVSLPEGYEKSAKTYPVLILLDGEQNIEHSVASARMLSKWRGFPNTIIVAIPSVNRVRDFTPTTDLNYSNESGGSAKFANFIENEVLAYVDKSWRTHPYRILEGHSLGGLFAASQLINNNSFFNAYIIIAPALWWDTEYAIKKLDAIQKEKTSITANAFFAIGEEDGDGMKQELKQFYDKLVKGSPLSYGYKKYEDEGHMSVTMPSMYDGLKHVFKSAIYDENRWTDFSVERFLAFTKNAKQVFGSSVSQSGELFTNLGLYLIDKEDFDGAIAVFKSNIETYPSYSFNHELLGDAYALNSQNQLAIDQYEKAAEYALASSSMGKGAAQKYFDAIKILKNPVQLTPQELAAYAGCYVSDSGSKFEFLVTNGSLKGSREGWADFKLFVKTHGKFFMRTGAKLDFEFNDQSLSIPANGQVYTFIKRDCSL